MSARRHPWWLGLAAVTGAGFLVGLGLTWRIRRVRVYERQAALARGERCIYALWHARLLALTFTHRGRDVAVLISQHRDGELIARIVQRLGYAAARGSSTRGGDEGMREMLRMAEERHLLAITPDGPRGPAGRVKPGLVYLASRTGFPIIPVAASASRSWVLDSWDRFRIPWPLATIVEAYGPPIQIPPTLDDDAAEAWRVRVEGAIHDVTREVSRLSGEER